MGHRLALVTFLTALAAASPAAALDRSIDTRNDHWVEVTGEGSVNAAPDFARVALGVTNTGKTVGEAMAANAKAANALLSLIKSEGVAPTDIQTSELSISPTFSQPAPGQQTQPTITGYNVSNNVTVMVRDIPRLGSLVDKAATAGANSIYGVGFGHNGSSALLDNTRACGRRRQAQSRHLRERRRRQDRPAHGAHRTARPSARRPLSSPRLRGRRRRSDANRSRRRQADGDRDDAV
jgi:uncharacterized protein YggE